MMFPYKSPTPSSLCAEVEFDSVVYEPNRRAFANVEAADYGFVSDDSVSISAVTRVSDSHCRQSFWYYNRK